MEKPTEMPIKAATERAPAPATDWVLPRHKQVERMGDFSSPQVNHFPQVRGGICAFCGVLDPKQPSQMQYKLCPHYRGMQLRCSYCPQTKDSDDVIYHSTLNIAEHPDNPSKLVVWCDSYGCSQKHLERFKVGV